MRERLNKNERKDQIKKSAKKIFLEKGFRNTVMDDIMKDTGLSRGGLYHHYGSTNEILYDIMVDGKSFREDVICKYIKNHKNIITPKVLAEVFVEKMVADNEYIPLYIMFLCELKDDENLSSLFSELKENSIVYFKNFMTQLGYESLKYDEYYFLINLINSSLLGCEILDARNNFIKNREYMLDMLELYFEEIQIKKLNNI
ncbi:HTH-type transcriptional regulator yfiR [Streptococcus agalactiae]|uniref:TetR/AcrR family transcriptional regulator n=1 Tax=Streptococcus agalactiae TaxID=1311 RepID=UPI000E08C62C|nr:TetR/AcrR family transcriptional regulator [Streptococcus agalactiae]SUN10201.1 HTH-type transcriptional regulator yfiR [Streptococcus agalactiae]